MAIDKQFLENIAQKEIKRHNLLKQLGITKMSYSLSPVRLGDPLSVSAPKDNCFRDEEENEYCLSNDEFHKFNQLLDRIIEENPKDNGKARVMEFLKPYKQPVQK